MMWASMRFTLRNDSKNKQIPGRGLREVRFFLLAGLLLCLHPFSAAAQVSYVARFSMEKKSYLLGEPIFCTFSIQNTGLLPFAFSFRNPTRILNPELEGEPRFSVIDTAGHRLADPAPRSCGGAKGTAVYGSVTLPPGQIHSERWLINQWARFRRPGHYRVRADRRLPLLGLNAAKGEFTGPPVAYASATNEIAFEVTAATEEGLRAAYEPYQKALEKPGTAGFPEAVLAVTALPQPYLLARLVTLAGASSSERRWSREQALEGLARLGTPAAWDAILRIARGKGETRSVASKPVEAAQDEAFRAYAILLLAEKGDPAVLSPILSILDSAPETLRGEIVRMLGFFRSPRANQVLFERLHSPVIIDRVNAILGLRNLEIKDAIPAIIAMLNDPEAQVRQVAHFALRSLTGQPFTLSSTATPSESKRAEEQWRAWWGKNGATFTIRRQPPCRDW